VWEQLPDPVQFLQYLKIKAGLSASFWSNNIGVSRYQTESFE
jgi:AMMECR1 domain-containing protein